MKTSTPDMKALHWTPPAQALPSGNLWHDIRTRTPDLSKPLALADLAEIALRNNPATQKAWNNTQVAADQVAYAEGYFMPELKAQGAATHIKTTASPSGFNSDYSKYGPGLSINYLIINLGGGRKAAVEQVLQTLYAADFAFNKTVQDILLTVETAYYGLISAKAGIESANVSVRDAKKTLEAAEERLKQGVGTQLDVLQAKALLDQSLFGQANAQGLLKIAAGNLASAIGIPADTDLKVESREASIPSLPEENIRKLIDDSLIQRPDIAALTANLKAKEAAVKVAKAAFWPSLYFNGSANENYYNTSVYDMAPGKTLQDRDWTYTGTLSLQWTFFNGFHNHLDKKIALEQAQAAKADLENALLAASADVWIRYHNFETAIKKFNSSEAYLKSSTAAYNLALDSYKAQMISILDLLNAETQMEQSRTQNIAARQDVFTAFANLAYSTGLLSRENAGQQESSNQQ